MVEPYCCCVLGNDEYDCTAGCEAEPRVLSQSL